MWYTVARLSDPFPLFGSRHDPPHHPPPLRGVRRGRPRRPGVPPRPQRQREAQHRHHRRRRPRRRATSSGVASENIVALCDVDAAGRRRRPPRSTRRRAQFADFRKLFDHASEFDAVVVSTCEHTHAFATLPALQLGKHVYCEKPLTHNIWEARVIREAAAKAKVATQMGTQIHASDNYRRVVELIQAGAIGPVREAHVWVSRAWGWQTRGGREAEQATSSTVARAARRRRRPSPAGLDWDLWLGPAPERPFHEVYVPGPKWYRWWDFGNGTMSRPRQPLERPAVLGAEAASAADDRGGRPAAAPGDRAGVDAGDLRVRPARRHAGRSSSTWYQGDEQAASSGRTGRSRSGTTACCSSATRGCCCPTTASTSCCRRRSSPDFKRPEPIDPEVARATTPSGSHACKTGAPTTCNFEYAGWLTEANHLGNVAYRAGKKLEWDAAEHEGDELPRGRRRSSAASTARAGSWCNVLANPER